jgi:hypothetical protein
MTNDEAAAVLLSLGVFVKRKAGSTGWPIRCLAAAGAVTAAADGSASTLATTGTGAVVPTDAAASS